MSEVEIQARAMVLNFRPFSEDYESAKQCALGCIHEIIKTHIHPHEIGLGGYHSKQVREFWQSVKEEIQSLQPIKQR